MKKLILIGLLFLFGCSARERDWYGVSFNCPWYNLKQGWTCNPLSQKEEDAKEEYLWANFTSIINYEQSRMDQQTQNFQIQLQLQQLNTTNMFNKLDGFQNTLIDIDPND